MTQENSVPTQQFFSASLVKTVLWGAAIGFILIFLFIFQIEGDPTWGEFWKIRPLVVVPIAGAMGGIFFSFMANLGREGGWKRIFTTLIGLLGYIIAIWLGSVFGLDGTLWN
ncbi:MAG TPA: potassium transporter KefB [Salinimicrobium sp.]|nr:potassium transporter KefB [Salinimicrobium sp.]